MPLHGTGLRLPSQCLQQVWRSRLVCQHSSSFRSNSELAKQYAMPSFCRSVTTKSSLPLRTFGFPRPRRRFSAATALKHAHLTPPKPGEELTITFVDQSSEHHTFKVAAGDNLLDIAQNEDLEMEGACGGSCACSTCHVIVESSEYYDKMEEPDDDENDMLDLAFGLTETSRLGCQVKMSKELDGMVVKLPSMTRNLQQSDFEKK